MSTIYNFLFVQKSTLRKDLSGIIKLSAKAGCVGTSNKLRIKAGLVAFLRWLTTPLFIIPLLVLGFWPHSAKAIAHPEPILASMPVAAIAPLKAVPLKEVAEVPLPVPQIAPADSWGNGYAFGWCTYGVASRIHIPNNWGDAYLWDDRAAAQGYAVGSVPQYGAIAVSETDSALGHVALVVGVGATSYTIWEMNGLNGWNTTDERVANPGEFTSFIYL